MVICGSYMFEFSVSKNMKKMDIIREVAVGKVEAHLCPTLIVKELKISVELGCVATTLNIVKHYLV
jgi:Mg/Co/Ni transporter MgtE